MHLFGLTGGIASGKSTAAARFRARRLPVIDADELARDVVVPGSPGLAAIAAAFGAAVIDPNGALHRQALARIVFADPGARTRLNAIVHPLIGERVRARGAALEERGEPLACYEAALIVENGSMDRYRPLVVVACPTEVQVARIVARDGISEAEALARVRAQKSLAEKVAVADHVIDTSGPIASAATRADDVLRAICAETGVATARYFGG